MVSPYLYHIYAPWNSLLLGRSCELKSGCAPKLVSSAKTLSRLAECLPVD